jgi:hypothetical protein
MHDTIIGGRTAGVPADELSRLAERTFALAADTRLSPRARKALAAAAVYAGHQVGQLLVWRDAAGDEPVTADGIDYLGVLTAQGLRELPTMGWSRAELAALHVARHLVAVARDALNGEADPATLAHGWATVGWMLDTAAKALEVSGPTVCLPTLAVRP